MGPLVTVQFSEESPNIGDNGFLSEYALRALFVRNAESMAQVAQQQLFA